VKAIEEELINLTEHHTWDMVDIPLHANIVGTKWVFRIKRDASGSVACYKARLVAQGFSQVEGIDFFKTYAPVARLSSIQIALAIGARLDLEIHQVDVKGAYLNGDLIKNEEIYIRFL
jgi:hypothetical protein